MIRTLLTSAMLTAWLQLLVDALTLTFGVLSLRVAAGVPAARGERRGGWMLTGVAYTLAGLHGMVQSVWAACAVWMMQNRGGGPVLDEYLRWQVVGNHGRGFLMVCFAGALLALAATDHLDRVRRPWPSAAGLLLALLAGSVLGTREASFTGGFSAPGHWSLVTITSAATVLLLLVALWRAVVTDALDRLLWTALLVYTLRETIDVGVTTTFAWKDVADAWVLPPRFFHFLAAGTYLVMIGHALWRLRMAREGREPPALFEPLDGTRTRVRL